MPSRQGSTGPLAIKVTGPELRQLLRALAAQQDGSSKLLRKALTAATADTIKAMRDEVLKPPPAKISGFRYGTRYVKASNAKKGYNARRIVGVDTEDTGRRIRSRGTRAGIAAGIRSSLSDRGKNGATLRIVSTGSKLPAAQRPMAKAYNTLRFRHPVFADQSKSRGNWKWAPQQGRPYFGEVIGKHLPEMQRKVREAYDRALTDLQNTTT